MTMQPPTVAKPPQPKPAVPAVAPKPAARKPGNGKPARKAKPPPRTPLIQRLARRVKGMRFRVLPIMIFAAVLMLGVRVGDVWRIATRDAQLPDFPVSLAQDSKADPKADPKANAKAPASAAGKAAPAPAAPQQQVAANAPPPAASPAPAAQPPSGDKLGMGDSELLAHYAERRAELEKRTREVEQREALLAAAEKRIEQKLAEMEKVRADIQKLMRAGDEKQSAQLESLVKIYETMKPKEAARIFEELDMPVLLDVFQRMKETKTAPILAAMDPAKAKLVTTALVERRVLPSTGQ